MQVGFSPRGIRSAWRGKTRRGTTHTTRRGEGSLARVRPTLRNNRVDEKTGFLHVRRYEREQDNSIRYHNPRDHIRHQLPQPPREKTLSGRQIAQDRPLQITVCPPVGEPLFQENSLSRPPAGVKPNCARYRGFQRRRLTLTGKSVECQ